MEQFQIHLFSINLNNFQFEMSSKLDLKRNHSQISQKQLPPRTFSQFCPYRTAISKSEESKEPVDITNTSTRAPNRTTIVQGIEGNKFSLGDIDLIESEYSDRTLELEQQISNYERQIQALKCEILQKQTENQLLRKKNVQLVNQYSVKSFKEDARLANSLVFEQQDANDRKQMADTGMTVVKETVKAGKKTLQFGENKTQKHYQTLIYILEGSLSVSINRTNPAFSDIKQSLNKFIAEFKNKQNELLELNQSFENTKKQYYKYLVQILSEQEEKQKASASIRNQLEYSNLKCKQLDITNQSIKQQLDQLKSTLQNCKTQIKTQSDQMLKINLENIQLKKSNSNTLIYLNTLLSIVKNSTCRQCKLFKYIQNIQQSFSLSQ